MNKSNKSTGDHCRLPGCPSPTDSDVKRTISSGFSSTQVEVRPLQWPLERPFPLSGLSFTISVIQMKSDKANWKNLKKTLLFKAVNFEHSVEINGNELCWKWWRREKSLIRRKRRNPITVKKRCFRELFGKVKHHNLPIARTKLNKFSEMSYLLGNLRVLHYLLD